MQTPKAAQTPRDSETPPDLLDTPSTSDSQQTSRSQVVLNRNTAPTVHGVVVPRVGGVLKLDRDTGEAFTGGSNLSIGVQMPQFPNQRRPVKYSSVSSFIALLEKGMEFKLAGPDEKNNDTTLTFWFQALAEKLKHYGLDTVFTIPNASWTSETYIAESWGKAKEDFVQPWVDQLLSGVYDPRKHRRLPECQYDIQNLYYSGTFILASLTSKYRQEMVEELGPSPHGPTLLVHILKTRLILVLK